MSNAKCLNLSHPIVKQNIKDVSEQLGLQSNTISLDEYKAVVRAFSIYKGIENNAVFDYIGSQEYNDFLNDYFDIGKSVEFSEDLEDKIYEYLNQNAGYINTPLEDTIENRVIANGIYTATEEKAKIINLSDDKFIIRINPFNEKRYQKEIEEIRKKAITNGTFMKAPNGQPTNLIEEQWLQVRTKAFKNWFGDWENDPENASKVVDENGEPRVMYHGTGDVFNTFDLNYFGQTDYGDRGVGFYFAYTERNAKSYGSILMPVFLNLREPFNGADSFDAYINRGRTKEEIIKDASEFILENAERTIKWMIEQRNTGDTSVYFDDHFTLNSTDEEIRNTVISEAEKKIKLLPEKLGNLDTTDGYKKYNYEVVVVKPNQIKSATDNIGTYSTLSDNIYYNLSSKSLEDFLKNKHLVHNYNGQLLITKKDAESLDKVESNFKKELTKLGYSEDSVKLIRQANSIRVEVLEAKRNADYIEAEINHSMSSIKNVMDFLTEKIPALKDKVHYNVSKAEAKKVLGDAYSDNVNSFVHNGEIYLLEGKATEDIAIEEALHILTESLIADNKALAYELLHEAEKLFPQLVDEIRRTYEGADTQNREILTQALARIFRQEFNEGERQTAESILSKFINWIKQLFGINPNTGNTIIELDELSTDMTLRDLAQLINSSNAEFKTWSHNKTQFNKSSKGELISSSAKSSAFARQLTNPGNNLTVEYKGYTFRNAEHAYQTWKSGEFDESAYKSKAFKPVGSKKVNKAVNFDIMVEIITAKLQQHPELIEGINERGGLDYILNSTHNVTGDKYWESSGENKFIEALAEAYKQVSTQPTPKTKSKNKPTLEDRIIELENVYKTFKTKVRQGDDFKDSHKYLIIENGKEEEITLSATTLNGALQKNEKKALEDFTSITSSELIPPHGGIYPQRFIGNGFDAVVRKYFNGGITELDSFDNISNDVKKSLITQLNQLEKQFDAEFGKGKYKVITGFGNDEIVVGGYVYDSKGNKVSVAGTLDMLVVTESGDIYIYDMKTSSHEGGILAKDIKKYQGQLTLYKRFIAENFPELAERIKGIRIISADVRFGEFNSKDISEGVSVDFSSDGDKLLYKNKYVEDSPGFINIKVNITKGDNYSLIDLQQSAIIEALDIDPLTFEEEKILSGTASAKGIDPLKELEKVQQKVEDSKKVKGTSEYKTFDKDTINDYSDDVVTVIKPTEIIYLGRQIMKTLSDFLNTLHKDDSARLKLLDSTKELVYPKINTFINKDRNKLLDRKLFNAALKFIKKEYFDFSDVEVTDPDYDKYSWISNNFTTIINSAFAELIELEGVSLNSSGDIIQAVENDNPVGVEDVSTREENERQAYDINNRNTSIIANMNQTVKRELSLIHNYDYNDDGSRKYDELGFPVYKITKGFDINNYLNKDEVITTIQKIVYNKKKISSMINSLKEEVSNYPWLEQVISKLESNEDNYQSKFFNTFYKSRTNYIKVYIKEEGQGTNKKISYVHADLVDSAKREAILDNINKKIFATNAEELPDIFTKSEDNKAPGLVGVSKDVLEDFNSYLDDLTGKTRKARETAIQKEARKKKALNKILDLIGIETEVNTKLLFKPQNSDRLKSLIVDFKALEKALSARTSKKETVIDNDITQPYYNISDKLAFFMSDHIEISYYDNGDSWMVFTQPTFIQTLVEKLKGSDINEEIDYEESLGILTKYNQFVSVGEDGHKVYVSKWLEDLVGNEECREILNHYVRTSVIDKKHFKQTPTEYLTAMLINFAAPMAKYSKYNVGKNKVAMYRMPIMSDKPAGDEIMFLKYGDVDLSNADNNYNLDYMKEQIADMSFNFFKLEVNRMRAIREQLIEKPNSDVEFYHIPRKKGDTSKWLAKEDGKIIPIKFNHKTFVETRGLKRFNGFNFSYCPMFNEEMTNNTEVGQLILDIINSSDENVIAEKFDLLRNLFNDIFINAKEKDFEDFKTEHASQLNKEAIIRSIGLKSDAEYDAFLQDFFWNDSFAAMNIYNLTIVDPAFYKDSIDLQKRYAQMHSSTSKVNTEATFELDGKQTKVSDGTNRTLFIADLEIVSELGNEVDRLFTLLEKEAKDNGDTTKALEYSILRKHLTSLFKEEINVTDGQSYSTLTGFWKKLYMLGQEEPELTKAIKDLRGSLDKIKNGEFSLENYEMCLQAFKPFVYSLVEHPNDTQALGKYVCPTQIKNSESLLFIGVSMLEGMKAKGIATNSHILEGLMEVIEETHWNKDGSYNQDGIDTIAFHSAVKNGNYAEIDLNDCKDKAAVVGRLKQCLYGYPTENKRYDQKYIKEIDFLDWGKQQEVPAHMQDHEQGEGSQNRIITVADMPEDFKLTVSNTTYKTDKKGSARAKLLKRYFDLIAEEMSDGVKSVRKELQINTDNKADKYKAISKLLVNSIVKDAKYTNEMRKAFVALENGDFVGAIGDPSISDKLFSAIFSLIKKNVNDQKFPGGPVVQVSVFGDEDLGIKYDNSETKEGMYYELMVTCPTEELEKKITVNTKSINKLMKKAGIDKLSRHYINGELFDVVDALALGLMTSDEAECIAYRIPTEDKYSIFRGRVVKFLPRQLGERIVAPKEITGISGADFDIDKLFTKFKYNTKELKNKQKEGTLNEKESEILKKRLRRNELFNIQYATMGHKSSYDKILNPGGFKPLTDLANIVDKTRGVEHSLMDIRGQLYFFEQNGGGKEYVGIAALNNISHLMCNIADLDFVEFPYFKINGKESFVREKDEYTKANWKFDTTYSLFDNKRISRTLGMFVGAAADNAKQAVLSSINIIPTTATLAKGLLRMGIPLETTVYLLNHPAVKIATRAALKANKMSAFAEEIREALHNAIDNNGAKEYHSADKRLDLISKTDFKDFDLLSRINSDEILENDKLFDVRVLSFLDMMMPYCQAISDVSIITSLNSTKNSVGPKAFDTIKRMLKIRKLFRDVRTGNSLVSESLLNIYDKIPYLKVLENCFSELVPEICGDLAPEFADDFLNMLDVLGNYGVDPIYMEEKDFTTLLNSWLLFKASSSEKGIIDASAENRKRMLYDFPLEFIQAQRSGTLNNDFIKSLNTPTSMNKYNKIINITFSSIGKSRESRADLAASWEELANSSNPNNVILSNNLMTYMMFRFGWSFSPKSAMNIVPNKAKEKYNSYKDIFTTSDITEEVTMLEFLTQYARNNWYSKLWRNPGLSKEDITFKTKGNKSYLIVSDPSLVENLVFIRFKKTRYVRCGEGVFVQVKPLGISKNFLEYNGAVTNSALMDSVVQTSTTNEQSKQYKGLEVDDKLEDFDSDEIEDTEEVVTSKNPKTTTSLNALFGNIEINMPDFLEDNEFKSLLENKKLLSSIEEKGFKGNLDKAVKAGNTKKVWDMLETIAVNMKEILSKEEIAKSYKNITKKFEDNNLC